VAKRVGTLADVAKARMIKERGFTPDRAADWITEELISERMDFTLIDPEWEAKPFKSATWMVDRGEAEATTIKQQIHFGHWPKSALTDLIKAGHWAFRLPGGERREWPLLLFGFRLPPKRQRRAPGRSLSLSLFPKAYALLKEVESKGRKEQRHHIEAKLGHPMTESEWRRLKRKNPRQQGPQPKSN
jgi:hypothetical protein